MRFLREICENFRKVHNWYIGRVYATRFWGCVPSTKTCFYAVISILPSNENENADGIILIFVKHFQPIIVRSVFL